MDRLSVMYSILTCVCCSQSPLWSGNQKSRLRLWCWCKGRRRCTLLLPHVGSCHGLCCK